MSGILHREYRIEQEWFCGKLLILQKWVTIICRYPNLT